MLSSCRSFALRAAAITALASVSLPQGAGAQPLGRFRTPQFTATAVKFKALHETHWNWFGSDEVRATFFDFPTRGINGTHFFGDVDAGESRDISPQESCIAPQPRCDSGASSLAFGITLLEVDDWVGGFFDPVFCHGQLGDPSATPPTPEEYEAEFDSYAGSTCYGDDLIGRAKVKLSQADLVAMLPAVGGTVHQTVPLTGGDGRYEFTYRLTRLPDRLNIPPIGPPVTLVPFVLSAALTPAPVTLSWTGASAPRVDIYREGALIVTTANDGDYLDPRGPGTYHYYLCNLGSTTDCTPWVQITVP